jgi:alkylation response protein AidB-like acyl-CoA dehydrogenase
MRFVPSPEQREFAASLADLLAASDVATVIRTWAAGDQAAGRKLWTRLGELGVLALGDPESGASPVDLVLAFEQLGRSAVPGPYVEAVAVLPVLGVAADPAVLATVAMPPHVPYALDAPVCDTAYVVDGDMLSVARVGERRASVDGSRVLASCLL